MERTTSRLRALLKEKEFVYMPAVYYPLGGRLAEYMGFDAAYVGGYVTGGSRAVSEPLLTMSEKSRRRSMWPGRSRRPSSAMRARGSGSRCM